MIVSNCATCGLEIKRRGAKPGTFCSLECKAARQRQAKPVDEEWLRKKYVEERLDCVAIGKLVHRDPKSVWSWLKDFGIPTRARGATSGHKFKKGHKLRLGYEHTEAAREKIRKARLADGRVPYLKDGKHHLKGKRGSETPNWKGGVTPERQSFYGSDEWKAAVKLIWKRDNATCQRCGKRNRRGQRFQFDIHHIVSFANKELRAEPSNLVLLCEECHYWIHSNANTNREFLR